MPPTSPPWSHSTEVRQVEDLTWQELVKRHLQNDTRNHITAAYEILLRQHASSSSVGTGA